MIKQKLINKRNEKGYSQVEIAKLINIPISSYNRRENGSIKIPRNEWNKLAKVLDCELDDIYEADDNLYVINNENANGNFGNYNIFNNNSDFMMETLKKYISTIEAENQKLKEENLQLKEELAKVKNEKSS